MDKIDTTIACYDAGKYLKKSINRLTDVVNKIDHNPMEEAWQEIFEPIQSLEFAIGQRSICKPGRRDSTIRARNVIASVTRSAIKRDIEAVKRIVSELASEEESKI